MRMKLRPSVIGWLLDHGKGVWHQDCGQPLQGQAVAQLRQKCWVGQMPGPWDQMECPSKVLLWQGNNGPSWQRLASDETGPERSRNLCLIFISCFQALSHAVGECLWAHLHAGLGKFGKNLWLTVMQLVRAKDSPWFWAILSAFLCELYMHLLSILESLLHPAKKNNIQ